MFTEKTVRLRLRRGSEGKTTANAARAVGRSGRLKDTVGGAISEEFTPP